MTRILVVHNKYSSRVPSGENVSVENEVRWLRAAGVDVHEYGATNDDIFSAKRSQKLQYAIEATWSWPALKSFDKALEAIQPDLIHVHNLFPLLSGSVLWAGIRRQVPIVWTARNRRVVCVKGTHFREGRPCHLCRVGWRMPGIGHRCYNNSVVASGLITTATSIFRRIARKHATTIAVSEYIRNWLVDHANFQSDRVQLKYNGVEGPADADSIRPASENTVFLFIGQLASHKGVSLLLNVWGGLPEIKAELHFVGDGPLAKDVRAASAADARIIFHGQVPSTSIPTHLSRARVVAVPSLCEESFGRVAAEALAYKRPVITSGRGGLGEVVDTHSGWITGTKPEALATAIQTAFTSDQEIMERGGAGRLRYLQLFSPEATTERLLDIYKDTMTSTHHDSA